MSLLIAHNLAKRFAGVAVFAGVSVQVGPRDRVGLVGPNGSGKTTLLNLLAGLEEADEGTVRRVGTTRVGVLPQEARLRGELTLVEELRTAFQPLLDLKAELRALEPQLGSGQERVLRRYDSLRHAFEVGGGYEVDSRLGAVLDGLGFSAEDRDQPVAHLSGGQAARASLAKLLLEAPDVLLLDEPTNHLDFDSLAWLEEFLSRWNRAYVIASHDRYLLERLVERTWCLDQGKLQAYAGNYSAFVAQRAEEIEHRWEAYYAQQEFLKKSEKFIQRNTVNKKTAGQARSRRKQLEKLDRVERPARDKRLSFELAFTRPSGKRALRLQGVTVGYPGHALFQVEHAVLDRGERVALVGPNGCGKTTLLRTLAGGLAPLRGQVEWGHAVEPAYFAQVAWDYFERDRTLVDAMVAQPGWTIPRARDLLGRFLFAGDEAFKKLSELSGGERSRVALARLAQLGGNTLLLDEPTNHLDIPARETLERVLLDFPGTVLFVSHDRAFIQKLATQVWEVQDGRLRVHRGHEAFCRPQRAAKDRHPPADRASDWSKRKVTPGKLQRQRERERSKLERQEEALTKEVQALEEHATELEGELERASYERDLGRIHQLSEEYERVRSDLEGCVARWEELVQQLERVTAAD